MGHNQTYLSYLDSTQSSLGMLRIYGILCHSQVVEFYEKVLDYDDIVMGMGATHSLIAGKAVASRLIWRSTILMASLIVLSPIAIAVKQT